MSLSILSFAQKGSWYVGGNVGYSSASSKSDYSGITSDGLKTTSWSFSPEFGTFLSDHWQLGLAVTLSGSKSDQRIANYSAYKSNSYGGTVYTRYFFGTGAFKPFIGANATILPGNSTDYYSTKYKDLTWGANANAGFGYAFSKKVTAIGSFGMLAFEQNRSKVKGTDNTTTTNTFGFNANSLGNRFTVGMYFTL